MLKSAHELVMTAKQQVKELATNAVVASMDDTSWTILDVREPDEFAAGHLPGAVNVPRGMLEFRLSANPAWQNAALPVLVYCKTGGRSALAAATMQAMGYEHVVSMAGGFDAWAAASLPVVTPAPVSFE
ncbi:rhodanese-like domain-containing protein [Leeia oryzae]|uniref:rhodanese-like domain-containing protein n=1 Tax=Leeia oryzae TaxID=356662 RepID=UPI00037809A2|nr:rhodanese-like domain-containing protein [Leeia oryzae]